MNPEFQIQKIPKKFYTRSVHKVAPLLLGKLFCRRDNSELLIGKIVEVEAYEGLVDKAAHTFGGKTKRNEIMFSEGGYLYVYFTYGMHFCANVVTGKNKFGEAVLIRAVEPLEGIELMCKNRFGTKDCVEKEIINLTNGPAKFCSAFKIDRHNNKTDLTGEEIFLADGIKTPRSKIMVSKRIGINKSTELPWRYFIAGNRYVTKHKFNNLAKPLSEL